MGKGGFEGPRNRWRIDGRQGSKQPFHAKCWEAHLGGVFVARHALIGSASEGTDGLISDSKFAILESAFDTSFCLAGGVCGHARRTLAPIAALRYAIDPAIPVDPTVQLASVGPAPKCTTLNAPPEWIPASSIAKIRPLRNGLLLTLCAGGHLGADLGDPCHSHFPTNGL